MCIRTKIVIVGGKITDHLTYDHYDLKLNMLLALDKFKLVFVYYRFNIR